jgi:hypothetical protein
MRLHQRRTRRVLAIAGAAVLAATAAACSSGNGGSSGGKVTITEFDYYTGGANAAMNAYNAQFMKAHPNIVVKRTSVPYANLITKILQDASAGDMPNLMLIDNPNVAERTPAASWCPWTPCPGSPPPATRPGPPVSAPTRASTTATRSGPTRSGCSTTRPCSPPRTCPRPPRGRSCNPTRKP